MLHDICIVVTIVGNTHTSTFTIFFTDVIPSPMLQYTLLNNAVIQLCTGICSIASLKMGRLLLKIHRLHLYTHTFPRINFWSFIVVFWSFG